VRRPAARRYVAAVPELSAGLPPVPGLPWESLSHRQVLAELAAPGWVPCGVGDWAVALRSPEGTVVARVCPWIELAADLEGGGSVVFLEFAAPVEHAIAGQVAEQWRTAAGDAELEEVRRAAQVIDAGYRKSTPWWGRCDLNEAHIRRAADGRLVGRQYRRDLCPQKGLGTRGRITARGSARDSRRCSEPLPGTRPAGRRDGCQECVRGGGVPG
jgi:hypothetical protein